MRQHGHHAIREVRGIAAFARVAIKRGAGPHVVRHIGDGDHDLPAGRILRRRVRLGVDRVVEVARVHGIDGDQRGLAEVRAPAQFRHDRLVCFL